MVQINFAKREITLQFAWLSRAGDGALAAFETIVAHAPGTHGHVERPSPRFARAQLSLFALPALIPHPNPQANRADDQKLTPCSKIGGLTIHVQLLGAEGPEQVAMSLRNLDALAWVFPEQRAALDASLRELALLEDRLRGAGLDPTTLPSLLQWPPGAPAGLVRWHERLQLEANHPADLLRGLQLVSGAVIGRLEHAYCDCMFATDRRWVWGDAVLHTNLDAGVTHCVSPRDSRPTPIL